MRWRKNTCLRDGGKESCTIWQMSILSKKQGFSRLVWYFDKRITSEFSQEIQQIYIEMYICLCKAAF